LSPQRTANRALSQSPEPEIEAGRQSYVRDIVSGAHPLETEPEPDLLPLRRIESKVSRLSPESAARRLIAALLERGVDTFFGVPGGPVCPVFEAIRLEPRARLVESRHESHAGFAATLFQRATGRVPALVVTAGPGATNAITGIASASLERAPMLVIAGDVAWATSGRVMAQHSGPEGIHLEAMFAPITRAQARAVSARSAVSQALAALDAACDERNPGPALFILPLDRAMEACDYVEVCAPARALPSAPPRAAVTRCAAWLATATRPLFVLGAGCHSHERALLALIDRAQMPFVTTPRAKGLISEKHPLSLRNGGMAASLWARRYTAEPVDVCIVIGTDLDDTSMGPTRYVGADGRLVHVDLDARVFGRNLPTALGITCDAGRFAAMLSEELEHVPSNQAALTALEEAKRGSPFDVADPSADYAVPIRPHRLLAELQAVMAADTCFVTDIGEHMLFCLHYLTAESRDVFHVQLNLGSMGSGIAGAVGLGLADRTRRVVCIAGDGGMQMSGMEALVAVREQLPILFVVFNDGRYNMVHHGMRQIFGEASAYSTPHVDFAAWARSFGMPAAVIREPGELCGKALGELLKRNGPALIDARIDPSTRLRGAGRVEALQHMSMLPQRVETESA
jgi:acetolactate synthase-1/2/3 large subunit